MLRSREYRTFRHALSAQPSTTTPSTTRRWRTISRISHTFALSDSETDPCCQRMSWPRLLSVTGVRPPSGFDASVVQPFRTAASSPARSRDDGDAERLEARGKANRAAHAGRPRRTRRSLSTCSARLPSRSVRRWMAGASAASSSRRAVRSPSFSRALRDLPASKHHTWSGTTGGNWTSALSRKRQIRPSQRPARTMNHVLRCGGGSAGQGKIAAG